MFFYKHLSKPVTHLHPAPSTSIYPHPAHFSLDPALCNTLNVIRTKISHVIGQFPKFRPKNLKLSILTENWHTWYPGGADFECRLSFLKLRPQDPFLRKFGPKKSNLSVLPENWHTWYLEDLNSYFNISFQNFQPKIHFWANLGQKTQSCLFCLKIGTHGISRMLILISILVF